MARKSRGTLYRRGKMYWLEYYVQGERVRTSLDTGDLRLAKTKRDGIINPIRVTDDAAKLRTLVHRLGDTETQLADIREEKREKITVADAWERYVKAPNRPQSGPATLKDFAQRWDRFVKWAEPEKIELLEQVTPEVAQKFSMTLSDLSANRFNKIIQTGRLVFRTLAPACKYMPNPFDRNAIAMKRLTTKSHRELSEAELNTVCSTAKGEMRALFAIGLYTALRLGDAATLRWEEVSFLLNRITRVPNKTARTGKTLVIPLHPVLRTILEEIPEPDRTGYVLPVFASLYARDPADLSHQIQQHFIDNKIQTTETFADQKRVSCRVGFHSLRHSFVSICAAAGVPLPVVQAICGHSNPVIQQRYIHLGIEATQKAINAMPHLTTAPNAEPKPKTLLESVTDLLADADDELLKQIHGMLVEAKKKRTAPPVAGALPAGSVPPLLA